MSDTTFFSRSAVGAAMLVLASAAQPAVPLGMVVHAIVERGDGKPTELPVADGGVLRSGDRLQVRVRAPRDGYVYVVAYGSSGSALLLHPFSGRTETARVRADEEMVVPAEGIYLPLDARPGREALFAIWSQAPLQGIDGLLRRMEAAAGDAERAEQILRGAYPDAQRVAFRHLDSKPLYGVDLVSTGMAMQYRATGTVAPLEERAASTGQATDPYGITSRPVEPTGSAGLEGLSVVAPDPLLQPSGSSLVAPPVSAEPDLDALLLEPAAEESVLGGSGSRLRAFETGQPSVQPEPEIVEPGASLQISPQTIGPGAPAEPEVQRSSAVLSLAPPDEPASSQETPPSGSGLTAAIAALFGGGASSAGSEDEPPEARQDNDVSSTNARVLPLAGEAPVSGSSPLLELQVPVVAGAANAAAPGVTPPAAGLDATASSPAGDAANVAAPTQFAFDTASSANVQAPDPSELGV